MLRGLKGLQGDAIRASDGELGKIHEILFDDKRWMIRYVVVETGGWLHERKVLIAPSALTVIDWDRHISNVNLTRDQVETSPSVDTELPVSRQWEKDYHDYYGWPYYWATMGVANGTGLTGAGSNPGTLYAVASVDDAMAREAGNYRVRGREPHDSDDIHLCSSREVTGYGIVARDGRIGHIEDLIVDDQTWRICYLAVDTHDWWPGKKVLLPPAWVVDTLWPERTVTVDVNRDKVRNGPDWDSREPISPAFESELSAYYAISHTRPAVATL